MSTSYNFGGRNRVIIIVLCVVALIIGALIGVGIYAAAGCKDEEKTAKPQAVQDPKNEEMKRFTKHASILDEMKAGNIRDYLK